MPDKWIIVSPDYTMVECGQDVIGSVSSAVGENLWDAFPGSEAVFRPVYERAFRDGCAIAAVLYAGAAIHVSARRLTTGNLIVSTESLAVSGLSETVNRLLADAPQAALAAHAAPATRRHLRMIQA